MKEKLSAAKKKADIIFSRYIRRAAADDRGNARCITCGITKPWKELQAGHYVSRKHLSLRFDERNVHPQCVGCNIFKSGNMDAYAIALMRKYGTKILKELDRIKQQIYRPDYTLIRETYREMLKKLDDKVPRTKRSVQRNKKMPILPKDIPDSCFQTNRRIPDAKV